MSTVPSGKTAAPNFERAAIIFPLAAKWRVEGS
jgi:hypothetical protein